MEKLSIEKTEFIPIMMIARALFRTIILGQDPKDNSDKPSAEMTCDGSQNIQEANMAMAFS